MSAMEGVTGPGRKRRRDSDSDVQMTDASGGGFRMPDADVLDLVDAAPEVEALDLVGMKRLVLSFEKKINKNREMRSKHEDDPEKFMQSEIDLDSEIKQLHIVATNPSLYPDFVNLRAVSSLLGLLTHANTDIAISVVALLLELTDPDNIGENMTAGVVLIDALLAESVLELLVVNLARLDEKQEEDAECAHNTLGVIENMIEWKPTVRGTVLQKTELLTYLLRRIEAKGFDQNKLYCSEMLAVLMQNSEENQRKFTAIKGMDALLTALSYYKKREPATVEEEEMVENLFDALCAVMMQKANQDVFRDAEGIELMLMTIKRKKFARKNALKAIDFALIRNRENCEHFVEAKGLGNVFGAFMSKGGHSKKMKGYDDEKDIEHCVSIISSLFNYCEAVRRERLLSKFLEDDFAKVERLVELHEHYLRLVDAVDRNIEEMKKDLDEDEIAAYEDEWFLQRLDGGLFTLQLVDFIMGHVCTTSLTNQIKPRVETLLNQRNLSMSRVKAVLMEYSLTYGDADDSDPEVARIRKIIEGLVRDLD